MSRVRGSAARLTTGIILTTLLASGLTRSVGAQVASPDGRWTFTVTPYLLVPTMKGTSGIGDLQVDVHASPGDIFSHLQFGAMLLMEANNGTWGVAVDGIYMNLTQDGASDRISAEAGMKQGALELTGFRRVTGWAEVLVGGRLNRLSAELQTLGLQARSKSADQTWFDPFIGARLQVPNVGKWMLTLRGDVGGFGVGSDLAWQVVPKVGYRFSKLFELNAAYRVISMDYNQGDPAFLYDMRIFGPEIGLAFHF